MEVQDYRGSIFRGVSVNGSKWQIFCSIQGRKYYVGIVENELEAARIFDRLEILHNGTDAKTNFAYTKAELRQMLDFWKTFLNIEADNED